MWTDRLTDDSIYLITQYGHPHCVKTPKASGTCKRPPCFLRFSPYFSLWNWSGGRHTGSLPWNVLRARLSDAFPVTGLFSAWLMKSCLPSWLSSLVIVFYDFCLSFFWGGREVINSVPGRYTCIVCKAAREGNVGPGPLPTAQMPLMGRQEATGGGLFHSGRSWGRSPCLL